MNILLTEQFFEMCTPKAVWLGLEFDHGGKRSFNKPNMQKVRWALQQLGETDVIALTVFIEEPEKYMNIQCNNEKICICSIQDDQEVIILVNKTPLKDINPYPDFPIEFCVPLDDCVIACEQYVINGSPYENDLPHKKLTVDGVKENGLTQR